jgi:hypothetical protein
MFIRDIFVIGNIFFGNDLDSPFGVYFLARNRVFDFCEQGFVFEK